MSLAMWSHEFSWKYFLVCNSLLEMSASTQTMNLKFGRYRFGKITVDSLQTKICFQQKGRGQSHVESSHT